MAVRIERDDVREMFSEIAPTYDRLNRLLSFGIDRYWRRSAIHALLDDLPFADPPRLLDLATGTGDVALGVAHRLAGAQRVQLVGADLALPMLIRAREKSNQMSARIGFSQADALSLPFADTSFDGAIIAFGLRNLENREAGLREMARVIRPAGRLVVLEFGQPKGIFGFIYHCYFRFILPRVGRLVSGHPTAYEYLPSTVYEFPGPDRLAAMMREAGFPQVTNRPLAGGIVQIHTGHRSL